MLNDFEFRVIRKQRMVIARMSRPAEGGRGTRLFFG